MLDDFLDSESSTINFSEPPFQPFTSQFPNKHSPAPSSYTDATPIIYPICSDQPDPFSPMTDNQLEHELDNFITLQQHIHNTNTLTIHQPTRSTSASESSIQSAEAEATIALEFFNANTLTQHPNS